MRINSDKDTVAVLLNVPRELYLEYAQTVADRDMKIQSHNTKLFIKSIEQEISECGKGSKKSKK
jgi:hypothetical protein